MVKLRRIAHIGRLFDVLFSTTTFRQAHSERDKKRTAASYAGILCRGTQLEQAEFSHGSRRGLCFLAAESPDDVVGAVVHTSLPPRRAGPKILFIRRTGWNAAAARRPKTLPPPLIAPRATTTQRGPNRCCLRELPRQAEQRPAKDGGPMPLREWSLDQCALASR